MIINSIRDGIVIDHIQAGRSLEVYHLLELDRLKCSVALVMNVQSRKMGRKDIIKIDQEMNVNLDVLGYIDPGITVNYNKDGLRIQKLHLELPE
ncbi:MAG: aspartate carbamoyltransferase regulatory subunit, partial [Oscillospiraceae bacterium]|nr:aspartate carbamoyltransferase regulatory subunit [Oscillospiraceae bacterium]